MTKVAGEPSLRSLDLSPRQRLAVTLRRSAELCESVYAYHSAELYRRAAYELDRVDREYREFLSASDVELAVAEDSR